MEFLTNAYAYFQVVVGVVGVASMVAAITPTPKDDNAIAAVRKVLDLLAFNFGNAKNR